MDKELLIDTLELIGASPYSWALYFFKINRKNNNPYIVYKVRFKNDSYILEYAKSLVNMVVKYQLGKITEIKDYTGENTKISCDKIETCNELIKEQWDCLVKDILDASDEKVEGKYHGYILEGTPTTNSAKSIIFLKMANPIINLNNKRSSVFTFDDNSELSEMSDEVCKLHMDTDCMVVDEIMYSFNYKFEDLFNIEKTMQKIKNKVIEEIASIDAFDNKEEFEQMAKSYRSPRTFVTLKSERVERIKNKSKRKKVANTLEIEVSDEGKFVFKSAEEVSKLLRYLCFKVFKDDETKQLLEASNVTLLSS